MSKEVGARGRFDIFLDSGKSYQNLIHERIWLFVSESSIQHLTGILANNAFTF